MIENSMYEHIVKNGKFAYFSGEVEKDKIGNIIDFKVIDINNSLRNKLNLYGEDLLYNASHILSNEFDMLEIIKKAIEHHENFHVHYFKDLKAWYEVDVQKINNTQFYVIMNETNKIDEFTQTLLDTFPAGIWYKDVDGRYITSSKIMLNNERVRDRDIKGKTDVEIQYSKKVAQKIMDHDKELIERRKSEEYFTFFRDNTTCSTKKICVTNNEGRTLGTLGFYIDITDHENLKSAYEKYKKLSDSLLQSIPDKLVYKDINGKYKYCNKSFLEYVGVKDEKHVIDKYDTEVFKYDLKQQNFMSFIDNKVLEERKTYRYQRKIEKDGHKYYFDIIKTPYFNEKEELGGVTAVIRDITEQQLIKNKIRQNQRQLNSILNGINDAIILSDKSSIIYVNKAFEDIFEINKKEYITNPEKIYELFRGEYEEFWDNYKHNDNYNLEIKIKTKDGKEKWIWYKGYLIDSKNDNSKKITIIRDITAKKEYDLELEKLKDEFLSNITHELKTPLNLIFSSLQLIDLKINNSENNLAIYDRYTNIIRQNSLRLLKLVNNIIDSTRVESGYLNCKYENGDIVYFVEQIFNSIEEYANSKNIQLIFDTDTEEKLIAFDLDKIERIILNLLSNAIKFNKENGKIYLTMEDKGDFTQISIKDTGIGIPKCKLESIFNRFTQVNNRMTKISEGSGIGLSLCKSLIEMQGGSISTNSVIGEGTEFIVNIPNIIIEEDDFYTSIDGEYNSFVKKLDIEFSDIY